MLVGDADVGNADAADSVVDRVCAAAGVGVPRKLRRAVVVEVGAALGRGWSQKALVERLAADWPVRVHQIDKFLLSRLERVGEPCVGGSGVVSRRCGPDEGCRGSGWVEGPDGSLTSEKCECVSSADGGGVPGQRVNAGAVWNRQMSDGEREKARVAAAEAMKFIRSNKEKQAPRNKENSMREKKAEGEKMSVA